MTNDEIKKQIVLLQAQLADAISKQKMTPGEKKIYEKAKAGLGNHLTMDESIPAEVGCAEAVSKVLSQAGYVLPAKGIPGTATLYTWLKKSPLFTQIDFPEQGAIILSPTGLGNGSIPGHTGIIGGFGVQYPSDFGICSNDSATGKFLERWSYERWKTYYKGTGGLPIFFFRAK